MAESSGGKWIAIDGKTLRRSFDTAGNKAALHRVRAWSEPPPRVPGPLATDAKSNEITAIPRLLKLPDISDLPALADAEKLLGHVRGHWGIENKLHGSLDVSVREDEGRHRIGHSAENVSRIRRLTPNLLRRNKPCQLGVKAKRLKACPEEQFLLDIPASEN